MLTSLAVATTSAGGVSFVKAGAPFAPDNDKLGPLPLPNRDSIEPLDSVVVLALTGFPRTPPCDVRH
jgi:hypothetical protein